MKTSGFWTHVLFRLLRLAFLAIRSIVWWFQGCSEVCRRDYESSAHVERIIWRSRADVFLPIKPWNFMGVHERFVHPNFVLQDDIVLCSLSMNEAIFVQLPSSIKNYTSSSCPFLWITYFEDAVRTISMPLQSLLRLAETDSRVSSFRTKAMLISTCGRSGSTLLAKLIQLSNRRVMVLSEPDPLLCLEDMALPFAVASGVTELHRVVRAAMLLSFKPVQDVDAIVMKARSTMWMTRYVIQSAPEIKNVYVQRRDRLKTLQSWERAFSQLLEIRMLRLLGRIGLIEWFTSYTYSIEEMHIIKVGTRHLKWTMFEMIVVSWMMNYCAYEYCKKEYSTESIYYEEITSDPSVVLEKVFRMLELDSVSSSAIDKNVLTGMKSDSQDGTPLSRTFANSQKTTPLTPELKHRLNAFMAELNMPLFE